PEWLASAFCASYAVRLLGWRFPPSVLRVLEPSTTWLMLLLTRRVVSPPTDKSVPVLRVIFRPELIPAFCRIIVRSFALLIAWPEEILTLPPELEAVSSEVRSLKFRLSPANRVMVGAWIIAEPL